MQRDCSSTLRIDGAYAHMFKNSFHVEDEMLEKGNDSNASILKRMTTYS